MEGTWEGEGRGRLEGAGCGGHHNLPAEPSFHPNPRLYLKSLLGKLSLGSVPPSGKTKQRQDVSKLLELPEWVFAAEGKKLVAQSNKDSGLKAEILPGRNIVKHINIQNGG